MSYGGGNPSRLAQGSSTYGSTGGYSSSTGGGYAAGSTGGSTGGYAAGATVGSTGGYAAPASGGSTGGYTATPARTTYSTTTTSAGGYAAPSTAAAYSSHPPQPRTSVTAVPSTTGYASGGYSGASSAYASPSASYASNPATAGYVVSQAQQQAAWVLEPVQYAGVAYLLDRSTSTVYVNNQGFMQIAGKWQNGQLVQRVRNNTGELFKALDELLRTQQVRVTDPSCMCCTVLTPPSPDDMHSPLCDDGAAGPLHRPLQAL